MVYIFVGQPQPKKIIGGNMKDEIDRNLSDLNSWMRKEEEDDAIMSSIINDHKDEVISNVIKFDDAAISIENSLISIQGILEDKGICVDTEEIAIEISKCSGGRSVLDALKVLSGDCDGD
jgi:hypothetical protein